VIGFAFPRLLVVVTALAAAASAAAQEPTDAQMETARAHFERGVELVGQEKWEEALVEFTASVGAMPTAPGLLNVGLCQRRLGRNLDAQRTFERFMSEFGATAEEVDRQDAQVQLGELRGVLGRILVEVDAGAELMVDDRPAGTAPLAGAIFVEPGEHTVVARLAGREPVSEPVAVAAGEEATVRIDLALATTDGSTVADGDGVDPVWFWTMVGVTGAAAVAWGITGGLALAADADYASDPHRTDAQRADGKALAVGADVCGALTGAAAAATLVLAFFTDWDEESPDPGATVTGFTATPVVGGMALGVLGRF
jgi:hypothetical protein